MDTERLYLREMTVQDLPGIYEIYGQENTTRYMEGLCPDKKKEYEFTKAYIENMYKFYGYGIWMICLKENDIIIGRAGLSNREIDGENRLELGYVIGKPYQHEGYAYEACQAICKFVKDRLYEDTIIAMIREDNSVSICLAEKLGFDYVCDMNDLDDVSDMHEDTEVKKIRFYRKKIERELDNE